MTGLSDSFQRPINYLRVSVTDRCNLRCIYCMPPGGICLLSHRDILTYEEIYTIAKAAAELGINKVRISGGEPLVRSRLSRLIQMLAQIDTIDDILFHPLNILERTCHTSLMNSTSNKNNISV